jgi:hypothetical protein
MATNQLPELTRENFVLVVLMEDPLIHSAERPFCLDPDCPCKEDHELVQKFIMEPLAEHRITGNQAMSLYWGFATPGEAQAIVARIAEPLRVSPHFLAMMDTLLPEV